MLIAPKFENKLRTEDMLLAERIAEPTDTATKKPAKKDGYIHALNTNHILRNSTPNVAINHSLNDHAQINDHELPIDKFVFRLVNWSIFANEFLLFLM